MATPGQLSGKQKVSHLAKVSFDALSCLINSLEKFWQQEITLVQLVCVSMLVHCANQNVWQVTSSKATELHRPPSAYQDQEKEILKRQPLQNIIFQKHVCNLEDHVSLVTKRQLPNEVMLSYTSRPRPEPLVDQQCVKNKFAIDLKYIF